MTATSAVTTRLLIDGGLIRHFLTEGMRMHTRPLEKDVESGVMLREEYFGDPARSWEARFDNGYPTILRDPATGLYRLYYSLIVFDPASTNTPLARRPFENYVPGKDRIVAWAVAESVDGVRWTKPDLGLVECNGDRHNNLLMINVHGTGIMLDADDPDANRRYKLITRIDLPEGGRAFGTAFSADGIHFTPITPWNGPVPRADTHNAPFKDHKSGGYGVTTRIWKDGTRVCMLSTSSDFVHWTPLQEIMRGRPPFDQVYSMPIFTHHGHYIGLPAMFHEGDRTADDFDLVDVEVATAYNVDSWQFVAAGDPLIERGPGTYPDGAFDAACVYAACPIEIDGDTWVYYLGSNGRHTGFREGAFGRARVDLDRLAGYRTIDAHTPGRLVVGPFLVDADDIEALIDVEAGGDVRWRLVDGDGCVPAGLTDAHHALESRSGWQALPLGSQLEEWRGREVCIEFTAVRAQVFALRTSAEHRRFG